MIIQKPLRSRKSSNTLPRHLTQPDDTDTGLPGHPYPPEIMFRIPNKPPKAFRRPPHLQPQPDLYPPARICEKCLSGHDNIPNADPDATACLPLTSRNASACQRCSTKKLKCAEIPPCMIRAANYLWILRQTAGHARRDGGTSASVKRETMEAFQDVRMGMYNALVGRRGLLKRLGIGEEDVGRQYGVRMREWREGIACTGTIVPVNVDVEVSVAMGVQEFMQDLYERRKFRTLRLFFWSELDEGITGRDMGKGGGEEDV